MTKVELWHRSSLTPGNRIFFFAFVSQPLSFSISCRSRRSRFCPFFQTWIGWLEGSHGRSCLRADVAYAAAAAVAVVVVVAAAVAVVVVAAAAAVVVVAAAAADFV